MASSETQAAISAPIRASGSIYTVAAASRLMGVPQPTIRSWVRGRTYEKAGGQQAFWPRLIEPPHDPPANRLSFWNLLEVQALQALRGRHEVNIPAVREALDVAQEEFGIDRLLIHESLRTLAGRLFLDKYDRLVDLSRGSRLELDKRWANFAERIDFGADRLGLRLRPCCPRPPISTKFCSTRRSLSADRRWRNPRRRPS